MRPGTIVLAVDPNGVVCGATQIAQAGRYGLLACYADDPHTPEDEGAQAGDVIRLTVDGEILADGKWTGNGEREQLTLGEWKSRDLYLPLIGQGAGTTNVAPTEGSLPEHQLWLPWIDSAEGQESQ